jgi:hypothetical protein
MFLNECGTRASLVLQGERDSVSLPPAPEQAVAVVGKGGSPNRKCPVSKDMPLTSGQGVVGPNGRANKIITRSTE